jgi:hypothetical protein
MDQVFAQILLTVAKIYSIQFISKGENSLVFNEIVHALKNCIFLLEICAKNEENIGKILFL